MGPLLFSVLLLKLAFTASRLEDAESAETETGQAQSLPLQRSPPQASDGAPERGCERLGAQGASGSQTHQGHHQIGIQGLDPAFQSTGHPRQGEYFKIEISVNTIVVIQKHLRENTLIPLLC